MTNVRRPEGRQELALVMARAVLCAGPAILEVYAKGATAAVQKGDGSPVTEADLRGQEKILAFLAKELPEVPVVSEEDVGERAAFDPMGRFILVDPLDGTREFIARNGEFTVNVALIERGAPVAGAVFAPALGKLWVGGEGAFRAEGIVGDAAPPDTWRPIKTRPAPAALIALASRSHLDPDTAAFLARLPIAERRSAGSSLKFCVVAEGEADVYPRFGPTMEWDTAAGHAVLLAAGGIVVTPEGSPLRYGKVGHSLRNGPFVAWGDPASTRR